MAAKVRWKLIQQESSARSKYKGENKITATQSLPSNSPLTKPRDDETLERQSAVKKSHFQLHNEDLKSELQQTKLRLEQKSTAFSATSIELSSAKEETKRLKTELESKSKELERLSFESQSSRYYVESLQSELTVLRKQVEGSGMDLSSLREECTELMAVHEESLGDIVNMKKMIKEANEKISLLEEALHSLKEKMLQEEHLKLTLSASEMILSQQIEDQTSRMKRMEQEVEFMRSQTVAYQEQVANFQTVVRECELQIQSDAENMRKMQETHDLAAAQSESLLRLKEAEIEALHEKIAARPVSLPAVEPPVREASMSTYDQFSRDNTWQSTTKLTYGELVNASAPDNRNLGTFPSFQMENVANQANDDHCGICNEAAYGMMVGSQINCDHFLIQTSIGAMLELLNGVSSFMYTKGRQYTERFHNMTSSINVKLLINILMPVDGTDSYTCPACV